MSDCLIVSDFRDAAEFGPCARTELVTAEELSRGGYLYTLVEPVD